jgi:hypothetical protein
LIYATGMCASGMCAAAQSLDSASAVQRIDAQIRARFENVLSFTVTEDYRVFRNHDEAHPVAEMTVKAVYQKETGKSYTILSQSGSAILRKYVLAPLLDNEKRVNLPSIRETAWFTSDNYELKLKSDQTERLDGHDCLVLAMTPRRKASNMLAGTMWVDASDYTMVQVQGMASKDPSVLTGPTEMMRQYTKVAGYAQAANSRAVSNSPIFGQTVVTIDYQDYHVQLRQ